MSKPRAPPPRGGRSASAASLWALSRKVIRLSDARLQAVSSRNMYSEHGLDARISPDALQVCQSFMVVLKCRPGSAEAQAAWPILSQRSRAFSVLVVFLLMRPIRFQSPSVSTARKKSSFSDTELLEFWPDTVR